MDLPKFLDGAEKCIPNFAGLKYTSGDLDGGVACLKKNRSVFLGCDTILIGALVQGFDSAIMTTLNIFPGMANEIVTLMKSDKVNDARNVQLKLNSHIKDILVNRKLLLILSLSTYILWNDYSNFFFLLFSEDWVFDMKVEFNKHRTDPFSAGPTRATPRFRKYLLHSQSSTKN